MKDISDIFWSILCLNMIQCCVGGFYMPLVFDVFSLNYCLSLGF